MRESARAPVREMSAATFHPAPTDVTAPPRDTPPKNVTARADPPAKYVTQAPAVTDFTDFTSMKRRH